MKWGTVWERHILTTENLQKIYRFRIIKDTLYFSKLMQEWVHRWSFIWGIWFFLVGMILFEETIKQAGKWRLKRVLQENTKTISSSVSVWLMQTFIFQSSTIVTMITLWFVWAWMIGMYNALWVVLWANVWSTLTPWLVYLLWFKTSLEQYVLPIIGVWWIAMMITWSNTIPHKIGRFFVSFSLLFLWLDYMKTSVDALAATIDLSTYAHWWLLWFTVLWLLITTIIQTSAWVMIIALTAVSSWLITLDMWFAIVIGANLGSALTTTLMWFLSSTRSQAIKKQVAVSHMVFNRVTWFIVILFIYPLKHAVIWLVGTSDPALVLAVFHTLFNLILLGIWIPFLKFYAQKVSSWFIDRDWTHQFAVSQINTTINEEVLQALHTDVGYLLSVVIDYNRSLLLKKWPNSAVRVLELYATIKLWEETILAALNRYNRAEKVDSFVYHMINAYDELLLELIASAKYLKDMVDHFDSIVESKEHQWELFYSTLRDMVYDITDRVDVMNHTHYTINVLDEVYDQIEHTITDYHETFWLLITQHTDKNAPTALIAELIKTEHYTMLSCQSLLDASYRFRKTLLEKTMSTL